MHFGYIKTPLNIHMKSRCIYGERGYSLLFCSVNHFIKTISDIGKRNRSGFFQPAIEQFGWELTSIFPIEDPEGS